MLFPVELPPQNKLRAAITHAYHMDETVAIENLCKAADLPPNALERIKMTASQLVTETRDRYAKNTGVEAFLEQYDLSSEEGISLMCLAESLLRVPDKSTVDNLIRDKVSTLNWAEHLGKSNSSFVNISTWGLLLTGKILSKHQNGIIDSIKKFIARSTLPVIRKAVRHAMKLLGQQFVMGDTIEEAIQRAKEFEKQGYLLSYDMLGEAARTAEDAEKYFQAYENAIANIAKVADKTNVFENPGISIKLSALHPRYEFAKHERVVAELTPRLLNLAVQAKNHNVSLTVDAEEADRLDLSLDIFEKVFSDPILEKWEGFGLAVQAYQKRAPFVLDWLIALARNNKKRLPVRLIKGAYWDYEIKNAQLKGLKGYPVFTRKSSTDVSYLACAKKMFAATDAIYGQFGTHNAYSVAGILELANGYEGFEFQCLHGMGYALYDPILKAKKIKVPCRIYAPVGNQQDLLAYLVRRLLENGANTSFINLNADNDISIEQLIADPVVKTRALQNKPHPKIPLPLNIYPDRKNSKGIDLTDYDELNTLRQTMRTKNKNPITHITLQEAEKILTTADDAFDEWESKSVEHRAACLEKAGDLFEAQMPELMALLVEEGYKTITDAIAEVREAIDYCRYNALQTRTQLKPRFLPGVTGETNELQMHGRGVIACISPWNFPLAIFIGQVTAALAAGNCVVAKPANQTPQIAAKAIEILHAAGIPKNVLHLMHGRGSVIGNFLASDPRVKGIVFTGSTETARTINQTMANRTGAIPLLIAETGGQNAMIVDSTALPEQVVADVLTSAFYSAGQRCSALRVLFLQEDIADKTIAMLAGAMAELKVGDPALLSTDIGPLIDKDSKEKLQQHVEWLQMEGKLIYQVQLSNDYQSDAFFAPCAYEIKSLDQLKHEVFGPVLHVVRFAASDLDKVIESINKTGYGLTLGIQSRINSTVNYIQQRAKVGNSYVNRNMIGAVVGVQPFGGENLSGTGPKAGGPHYIPRLCLERLVCINTTAAGGNASLLTLQE